MHPCSAVIRPQTTTLLLLLSLLQSLLCSSARTQPTLSIQLNSPRNQQVVQRLDQWTGRVPIEGSVSHPISGPARVEARFLGEGLDDIWRPVAELIPGTTNFSTKVNLRAGGWYRLEIRVVRKNTLLAQGGVNKVGVGEIFVVSGQSNSANHGDGKLEPKSDRVVTFTGAEWVVSRDPQPGASGNGGSFLPPLGDALVARYNVPVGFIATGIGATSVREWLPRGTRFSNPPTLTGNVTRRDDGSWESTGTIYRRFVDRLKAMGPSGFRAILWHQGESDANQQDKTRTLSGADYERFMNLLIGESRRELGWDAPWFVAQVSYHTPEDRESQDIRNAQASLWSTGTALEGPDTDKMGTDFRDGPGGRGIHFSAAGLKEHAARWMTRVSPWMDQQLAVSLGRKPAAGRGAPPRLDLNPERFQILGRNAFVLLPQNLEPGKTVPWIFYAPTLPGYPDEAERWMHEQFLAAGIAIAGVDVGEAYGNPASHRVFNALYQELTERRRFARKVCLFGRSRGGLWVSSWAISDPTRISGIIGIYPVYDFTTYPGIRNAAPAYGLTPAELLKRQGEFNPIRQGGVLARAGIPVTLIHGDIDVVVPLKENSAALARHYQENNAAHLLKLIELKGQGHNFYEGFFHSQELVDFAIRRARVGAGVPE